MLAVEKDGDVELLHRAKPGADHRITSYNVCYTKLLRVTVHITYLVGSRHESYGEKGMRNNFV